MSRTTGTARLRALRVRLDLGRRGGRLPEVTAFLNAVPKTVVTRGAGAGLTPWQGTRVTDGGDLGLGGRVTLTPGAVTVFRPGNVPEQHT